MKNDFTDEMASRNAKHPQVPDRTSKGNHLLDGQPAQYPHSNPWEAAMPGLAAPGCRDRPGHSVPESMDCLPVPSVSFPEGADLNHVS